MYANEPEPTPFDLNWRMFGVDIRVHPFFWVLAAFLGWGFFNEGRLPLLLLWIGCVFVSVLLHEFGHVMVGRFFGAEGRILLYSFGGLAIGSSNLRSRWQRVLVYLAGPGIQFVLAAVARVAFIIVVLRSGRGELYGLKFGLLMLQRINVLWAVFNLLPIFPLDGGQVCREVCEAIVPGRGAIFALGTSVLFCGAVALAILAASLGRLALPLDIAASPYNALLFAMFAANSFQMLQFERARRNWDDRFPWER